MEEEEKSLNKQKELEKQLEILLLPKDPNDGKNIMKKYLMKMLKLIVFY